MSRRSIALALALVASVATNIVAVVLLLRRSEGARAMVMRDQRSTDPPLARGNDGGGAGRCATRLVECQRQGWDIVARAIEGSTPPSATAHRVVDAGPPNTDADTPAAALCRAAERSMREQWERDRTTMITDLTRSFGDAAEQERNVLHEVDAMARTANLDPVTRDELLTEYRPNRLARVAAARAALEADPPDVTALAGIARGLFADEDAALARVGGNAARDAWRARQFEGRTVILAITATLAGQDWSEVLQDQGR